MAVLIRGAYHKNEEISRKGCGLSGRDHQGAAEVGRWEGWKKEPLQSGRNGRTGFAVFLLKLRNILFRLWFLPLQRCFWQLRYWETKSIRCQGYHGGYKGNKYNHPCIVSTRRWGDLTITYTNIIKTEGGEVKFLALPAEERKRISNMMRRKPLEQFGDVRVRPPA